MTARRLPWWLPAVAILVAGFALSLVQPQLAMHRDIRLEAMRSLVDLQRTFLGDPGPAIRASRRLEHDPDARIYDQDLSAGSAFIYPPLAALMYRPLADLPVQQIRDRLAAANHVLWLAVVLIAAKLAGGRRGLPWPALATSAAACILFYPLVHAVQLNQATLVVTVAIGGAWLALDAERPATAGVAFALALAIKPQLALALPLMLWHAPRMVAAAAVAAAVLAVSSFAYAGVANNVDYVTRVLPALSRGYAYYANQGFNGFFYRWVPGGDIGIFAQRPRSPVVDVLTLLAAAGVLTAAALQLRRSRAVEPAWAFGIAWLAATMVSPICWQHHYSPALFAFALLARALHDRPALRARYATPAAIAFTLMAIYLEVRPAQGVLARLSVSYVLFGALALGATFVRVAREPRAQ
jgi:hypothetical protein